MNLLKVVPNDAIRHFPEINFLTEQELDELSRMQGRIETLGRIATKANTKVFIDAEQTYFQPALSRSVSATSKIFKHIKVWFWMHSENSTKTPPLFATLTNAT